MPRSELNSELRVLIMYFYFICVYVLLLLVAGGAWLVAQRAEQRRRFKAVLCAKPKDYARVHADRIKGTKQSSDGNEQEEEEEEGETNILDGFFLVGRMKM